MIKKHPFIPLCVALLTLFFIAACHESESALVSEKDFRSQELQLEMNNENSDDFLNKSGNPGNTIPITTFNTWNMNWETHWRNEYISNFTMPLSNLQNIVNTQEVVAARFHLGFSETDDNPHLTLVGVNASGESMLSENDHIYNFTQPCPTACPNEAPSGFEFPPSGLEYVPENTISLATFNSWISGWESHWDKKYIKYFTMPLSNIQSILNTNGVVASRFYIGYSEEDSEAHLILVGVDSQGFSMVGANTNIYNYSNSCPPICN